MRSRSANKYHNCGALGLNGFSNAFAPFTFTLRLYTLSPHVTYRTSISAPPKVMFDNLPGALGYIKTGKLRALGVTAGQRVDTIADVPTISESVPGYDVSLYYGVSGPKGIPPAIVEALSNALQIALRDPKMMRRIAEFGDTPLSLTAAEFGKLVSDETERWGGVVGKIGLAIE